MIRFYAVLLAVVLAIATGGLPRAEAITQTQENMIGLPNRFAVVVSDFERDGLLSPDGVKSFVESLLNKLSIVLLEPKAEKPLALINVNVTKIPGETADDYKYQVDMNVYNLETINKTYTLREGTVWRMGSYVVTPTESFPEEVEDKISELVNYFIFDYFTANPQENKSAR